MPTTDAPHGPSTCLPRSQHYMETDTAPAEEWATPMSQDRAGSAAPFPGGHAAFAEWATRRLTTPAVDVWTGAENVGLFRDSLLSALAHTRLSQTPCDPSGTPLSVMAGYLETMAPNACADHENGKHLIAMNSALFVAIQEFAMYCFTQREFFPEIGDASLEVSPPPLDGRVPGLWLLDYTKHGGRVEPRHGQTITPRGESRYVGSVYLGMLMARFVWLHEFIHCMSGHARLAQLYDQTIHLNEIEVGRPLIGLKRRAGEPPKALPDRVHHCMELDADRSAFWGCCQVQLAGRENVEGIAELGRDLSLRLALFGAYAMTWLFEEFQNYGSANDGKTHPPPYLRLQNLVKTARLHLEPIDQDFGNANRDACAQFDKVRRSIPSLYRSDDLYAGLSERSIQAALEDYEDELRGLRKDLAPFRYGEPV